MRITIRSGLDVQYPGAPEQTVRGRKATGTVALNGSDFPGGRPEFCIDPGAKVSAGQPLFVDRSRPQIVFTSPASGTLVHITRGHRRALDAAIVEVEGDREWAFDPPRSLDRENVRSLLLESGQWVALRTRPFGRIPDPDAVPAAIFVTAIDTEPLAADPAAVLSLHPEQYRAGLQVIRNLTTGPVFVCCGTSPAYPTVNSDNQLRVVEFRGPHPAGLPGTHIHKLMPVGRRRQVWHIGYQDVIAIGHLFQTGRIWAERVVSMAGPAVRAPALVRTSLGADLHDVVAGELSEGEIGHISGSILSGRPARYLGRYHTQLTALRSSLAARQQALPAWLAGLFATPASTPIIPIEAYDGVMPLDIPVVPLLRALHAGDAETAESFGCLELAEEDMQLLSYVCPAKADYAMLLRSVLNEIEKQM